MSSFPEWARPWLASQNYQVSHGLNLVLPLDPAPNLLPLLLWDIVLAQDKIKRALEELAFVHFARFIPSWDGRALMVTTEFDGPLDPYVLDFVIALGDVFDTLLSYVRTNPAPPKSVRDDPEGFLAWVKRWNRVPFYLREGDRDATLFPENFDYPLYSAYPDKTVTDIVGPRSELPPALDHPAANVEPTDVQGNILQGYRAKHVSYLMFSVANPTIARNWLAQDFQDPGQPWLGLTSAAPWVGEAPKVLTQIGFTFDGLARLLPPTRKADLQHFPTAYAQGATTRATDNFDTGSSHPDRWLFGGAGDHVEVVLILYTRAEQAPQAYVAAVNALKNGAAQGLHFLREFAGTSLDGTVSFGFKDGISDPGISGQCPNPASKVGPSFQPSASPGEFLLHRDYVSIYGGSSLGMMPAALVSNGSFGVLRLMEADESLFTSTIVGESARLQIPEERLKAKLMGRWLGGTPLTAQYDVSQEPVPPAAVNDFDYAPSWEFPDSFNDHEGLHCPVGAHIRRANPRSARVAGQRHGRRLLRRGMPVAWQDPAGTPRRGLMGLFMGANIEQQFEFIQQQWLNGGLAASGIHGTTCPITGSRIEPTEFPFLEPEPDPNVAPRQLVAKIPQLVSTRGCLYLFFPGISALKALNAAQAPTEVMGGVVVAAAKEIEKAAATAVQAGVGAAAKVEGVFADVLSHFGIATGGVASAIAESAGKVSRLIEIDGAVSSEAQAELEVFLSHLQTQTLGDGDWRSLIRDLINRNLDSPWVQKIIDAFAPMAVVVQPAAGTEQGDIDLGKASFRANPYPVLQGLRAAGKSIVWVKEQQAYWVLSYAGCKELLNSDAAFVQARGGGSFRGIVTLDGSQHQLVRGAFLGAFRTAMGRFSAIPSILDEAVTQLDRQTHLRQFDFMQAYAHPVARTAVWQFLGIDDVREREALDKLADRMVENYGHGNEDRAVENVVFADAALRLAGRLSLPLSEAWTDSLIGGSLYGGSLIGELAKRMNPLPVPGRPLGFIETLITLVQTVAASQSPHFLLGSAAWHLLQPLPAGDTAWAGLGRLSGTAGFDDAVDRALNEARRYEPPLSMLQRFAKGDQTISGVTVPDGCQVNAMVASANRDVTAFGPDSEDFLARRTPQVVHLSLGFNAHECAGAALQAPLVKAALSRAITAWPGLRLSNPAARPPWQATIYFRVLQALSVLRCS